MAKQIINVGTTANDKKGDSLRAAFQKVNTNFTELYTALGLAADVNLNLGNFVFTDNTLSLTNSNNDDSTATQIEISQPVRIESNLTVGGDILPNGNLTTNLGSPTNKFHSIFVGTGSVYLGDAKLSLENGRLASSVGFDLTDSVGVVNGTVGWIDVTSKPSMFDIGGNVVGIASSETITEETVGGTISETVTLQSQIEIESTGIVIAKRTIVTVDDGVTTSTDEAGSTLTVNNAGAVLKHYVEPEGPNNGSYFQIGTTNAGAMIEGVTEDLTGTTFGRVAATQGTVEITTGVNGTTKGWLFDIDGVITVPSPVSPTMTLTFDASHYVATGPKPTLTLTSTPWELMGEYVYAPDGQSMLALNNIWPTVDNPGYETGDQFTFDESVHGLTGHTLIITLDDVVQAGPAGWTANVIASTPPTYPSTVQSEGAIKVTSVDKSWIFGTDGKLTLPGGTDTITSNTGGLDISVLGMDEETMLTVNLSRGGALTVPSAINFNFLGTYTGLINAQPNEIYIAGAPNKAVHIIPNDGLNGVFIFGTDSGLTLPSAGFVRQRHSFTRTTTASAPAATSTVVWSANQDWTSAIKLTIQVEGIVTGDSTGWHVQACEATIASRGYANGTYGYGDPEMTVYGVIHTSVSPLATFEVQRNPTTRFVEVVATGADINNNIIVSIHSVEIGTTD